MPKPRNGIEQDDDASTPLRPTRPGKKSTRKETILSLVEMLLQNAGDNGSIPEEEQISFEDDKDVPTVDEHLQVIGAETFHKFQKRLNNLDKELRNFANAARQLGSSAAILSSAFHLRERLAQIMYLYRENAADLFPRKVVRPSPTEPTPLPMKRIRNHSYHVRSPVSRHFLTPQVCEDLDLEDFPDQFNALAKDVTTFMNCLNEFPEFTDEAVNASITTFDSDLKYWASCLREYSGQFRYPAVQRYLHDLTSEMGEHIDAISSTLSMFIEVGVPTIRFAQKHGATNLLNLSTVATFFSAVTATTLQFSFELDQTNGAVAAVNSFWFASLVFSIAAAVNSLLGLTWKQAMYRSPGHRVPWWVLIWIKRSPLVFLVMSVASFSVGLCVFAYASHQHHVTSTITTVFTAFTSFGLLAVSAWFASERWAFTKHSGKKWLSDVILEATDRLFSIPGVELCFAFLRALRSAWFRALTFLRHLSSYLKVRLSHSHHDEEKHEDLEANGSGNGNGNGAILPVSSPPMSPTFKPRTSDVQSHDYSRAISPTFTMTPTTEGNVPASILESPSGEPSPSSPGRQLWQNAIRTVKMRSAVSSNLAAMASSSEKTRGEPSRQRTLSSTLNGRKRTVVDNASAGNNVLRSRIATLTPQLKCLETTKDLTAHQALVKHMQFSPNGKYLATSSWDRTSLIFKVGDPFVSHRILAHAKGFVHQVAWSPSGHRLLTKLSKSVKVWTEDGVCQRTIERPCGHIESITWLPDGESFLSVEGTFVVKLDLKGNVTGIYDFGNMKLHDVAVTPDGQRLFGVGPLLESKDHLKPSKPRSVEKRLAVYNTITGIIEHQTPVLNDVRDITLAKDTKHGLVALVSYENKAPPQLWKIDTVKDHTKTDNSVIARFVLRHTYMPKVVVEFAGPSYFGGKDDELVLCAGKAGDIHIWDRESGALLHHVRAQALGGDLTCIAWNPAAADPFMFATGSHDGAVRIWTRPAEFGYLDPQAPILENGGHSAPYTPRTSLYDMDRTDSPLTQQEYQSTESVGNSEAPLLRERERTIMFAEGEEDK